MSSQDYSKVLKGKLSFKGDSKKYSRLRSVLSCRCALIPNTVHVQTKSHETPTRPTG
jgi:hypothetical protein